MTWNKMWNIHFLKSYFLQDYSSLLPFKYSPVLHFPILCNNSVLPLSPYFTISSPIFSHKVFLITHYMNFSHSLPHVWQKALGQFLCVKSSTMVAKRRLVDFQHKLKSPSKIKNWWPLHPTVVSAQPHFRLPITNMNPDQMVWVLHSVSERMWLSTLRLWKGLTNLAAPWGLMKWAEKGLSGKKAQV